MHDDPRWNGHEGRGGITWAERSRMGRLRGVLDPADTAGGRNRYFHLLHEYVLRRFLKTCGREFMRALDFGCGTGRFLPLLAQFAKSVYAVDRSAAMVEAARTYNGLYANSILQVPEKTLPYVDGFFDLLVSFCVLSVTARELVRPALDELARVSAKGATFVLYEKVCERDGLTVEFYQRELQRAGFRLTAAQPVRSGTSRVTRLAAKPWFGWAAPAMVRAEVELTRYRPRRAAHAYVEHLFIASAESSGLQRPE